MIVLCHRDTPTNATGLPWLPLCSQGNGVQGSRCGRLPNLQQAQRNFDVCDDRRSADIRVSLRGSAPSFLQGSHFDSTQVKTVIRHNSQEREGDVLRAGTNWPGARGQGPPVREMVISCKLLQTLEEDSCDVPQKGRSSHGRVVRFW